MWIDKETDVHYQVIRDFYSDKKAKRSGVPYMNHIDEGLVILNALGASVTTQRAWCLHPLLQKDATLVDQVEAHQSIIRTHGIDITAVILAMEYRAVANAYLYDRYLFDTLDIKLSPLFSVQLMLIADKVQNKKDFEKYQKGKHVRSTELTLYFDNWMKRLWVGQIQYERLVKLIDKDFVTG